MIARLGLLLAALGLALLLVVPAASAKVTVLDNDGNRVDTFNKASCRLSGGKGKQDFFAVAKSESGNHTMTVFIDEPLFQGFGEDYTIFYGGEDPQVFLRRRSDDEVFSNFAIPGTPPGVVGGGAVKFSRDGRTMGIGLAPASNKSYTEGVSFAGSLRCKYPRKKR